MYQPDVVPVGFDYDGEDLFVWKSNHLLVYILIHTWAWPEIF
jgi:hypothetical protein